MNWRNHITRNPQVCGGVPIVKGTRIPLRTVLANLAAGESIATIVREYPSLTESDVRAVIAFAATSSQEDLPVLEAPNLQV